LRRALNTIKASGRLRPDARAISLIKGLDVNGKGIELASEVISEALNIDCSVMMGANLANEIAQEMFCESTIGYSNEASASVFKSITEAPYFKISCVPDVTSVELCGALKNIIAVGAGIIDGLSLGDNTKAAIIRIGLDEMRRFSALFSPSGQVPDQIFFESCGVADLITSCFGGRNRRVGEALVRTRKTIVELENELLGGQKLQGPPASVEVFKFLREKDKLAEFPLMVAIYQVCYEHSPPQHIIDTLSK